MDRAGRVMDAELNAVALLEAQIGVADQELLAAAVRAKVKQLVDRWGSFAERQLQARAPAVSEFVIDAQ